VAVAVARPSRRRAPETLVARAAEAAVVGAGVASDKTLASVVLEASAGMGTAS
jgi:hypothetical protein